MFRNWTKKSAIIYLVGGALLFVGLFLVSFVLVIWADGQSQYELTELQKIGISALGGFVPLASKMHMGRFLVFSDVRLRRVMCSLSGK